MKLMHENATPESVQFLRSWVFGMWFLIILCDPFVDLQYIPAETLIPTGFLIKMLPGSWIPNLLTAPALSAIKFGILASVFLVLCGKFKRTAGLLAAYLIGIHQGIIRGYGFLNHAEVALIYVTWVLVAYFWLSHGWEKYSDKVKSKFNVHSFPWLMFIFIVGVAYAFVGIQRFFYGGWDLFKTDSMIYWVIEQSNVPRYFEWHLDKYFLGNKVAQTMLILSFPAITMVELLTPFIFINRWIRYCFIVSMISFHCGVWLLMDLLFWEVMLLYVVMFDITPNLAPKEVKGEHPVIFYDGVCGMCNTFVKLIMKWDRTGRYKFAPLQGDTAKAKIGEFKTDPKVWTIVLMDEDGVHTKSKAVFKILSGLGGFVRFLENIASGPRRFCDGVYALIARYRYNVTGKYDACPLPKPGEAKRFLP